MKNTHIATTMTVFIYVSLVVAICLALVATFYVEPRKNTRAVNIRVIKSIRPFIICSGYSTARVMIG